MTRRVEKLGRVGRMDRLFELLSVGKHGDELKRGMFRMGRGEGGVKGGRCKMLINKRYFGYPLPSDISLPSLASRLSYRILSYDCSVHEEKLGPNQFDGSARLLEIPGVKMVIGCY